MYIYLFELPQWERITWCAGEEEVTNMVVNPHTKNTLSVLVNYREANCFMWKMAHYLSMLRKWLISLLNQLYFYFVLLFVLWMALNVFYLIHSIWFIFF